MKKKLLSTASALVFLSTSIFFNENILAAGPLDEIADELTAPSPNARTFTAHVEKDLLGPVLAGILSSGKINGSGQGTSDFSDSPYAETTALHPRARVRLPDFTFSSATGPLPSRADLTTLSATLKVPAHSSDPYELTFTLPGLTATSKFPITFRDLTDRANGVLGACVRELKGPFEITGNFDVTVATSVKQAFTLASQERDTAKATLLTRDSELAAVKSQLQAAEAQALQLKQDVATKAAELLALQSSSASGIAAKDVELTATKSQLQAAEAQVLQLKQDVATKDSELVALQSTSTSSIAAKDVELAAAKSQLQAAEAQVLQLKKDVATKDSELVALQSTSTSSIAAKDLDLTAVKSQLQTAEAQVLQLKQDVATKDAELVALKESAAKDLAARDAELASTRSQLQAAQAELASTTSQLQAAQTELSQLQHTLGAQQEEMFSLRALSGQLEEARGTIAMHADVKGSLEAQAASLRAELSSLQSKLGTQEEEMSALRGLRDEVESLRARSGEAAVSQEQPWPTAEMYKDAFLSLLESRTLAYDAIPQSVRTSLPW